MNLPQSHIIRPRSFRIDLSTARSEEKQAWNFTHFRIANASSSTALLYLKTEEHSNSDVLMYAGRRLKNWPTTTVWITNTAQADEWVDIEYWGGPVIGPPEIVDDAVVATLPGSIQAQVSGFDEALPQEPVLPRSIPTTSYYRRSTSGALNTIVAKAANTSGLIVRVSGLRVSGGNGVQRVMMAASVPTAYSDGAAIASLEFSSAEGDYPQRNSGDVWAFVPANYGLYEQCSSAVNASGVDLSYDPV